LQALHPPGGRTAAEDLGAKLGVKVVIDSDTEGVTGVGWPRRGRNGARSTQIVDFSARADALGDHAKMCVVGQVDDLADTSHVHE
jgi:hypothetical protein